jgi:UDP-N-acetylglucosamine--dolichyl-phosphate N-acetylglucosaminephosphotransferase
VPVPLHFLLPTAYRILHLGPLYYVYMAALVVFSTNSINILAGVNGVEGVQGLVIAASLALNDVAQLVQNPFRREAHLTSLYFLLPYMGVCLGYLAHNWYPSRVFGGDTFCYFSGMIFAVVGILGNFSKTVLLFMLPQIGNFVLSTPQLFHVLPCPRHRMPRLHVDTGLLEPSTFVFGPGTTGWLGRTLIWGLALLHLVRVAPLAVASTSAAEEEEEEEEGPLPEAGGRVSSHAHLPVPRARRPGRVQPARAARSRPKEQQAPLYTCTNLTLINALLVLLGPLSEEGCALAVLAVQLAGSGVAFLVRYVLVHWAYGGVGST